MSGDRSRRPPFHRAPIVPDRIRQIGGESFAFIPHRFLRDGFLASLSRDEIALYLVLVLAADRNGVSFYGYDSLCSILECTLETFIAARNGLIQKNLVAFDGSRFQVLSLPDRPVSRPVASLETPADLERGDPASIRRLLLASLENDE